jgi:hypothetical protein
VCYGKDHLDQRRQFQVWSYTTSHGQLLLRSSKSINYNSRFDVLFKDVAYICIPAVFNCLKVIELDGDPEVSIMLGDLSLHDRTIFRIAGEGYSGYIVAGAIFWNEDQGEYDEPSPLLM